MDRNRDGDRQTKTGKTNYERNRDMRGLGQREDEYVKGQGGGGTGTKGQEQGKSDRHRDLEEAEICWMFGNCAASRVAAHCAVC